MEFINDFEKEYWVKCIQHAENLKEKTVDIRSASDPKYYWRDYVEYADKMVIELRKRIPNT